MATSLESHQLSNPQDRPEEHLHQTQPQTSSPPTSNSSSPRPDSQRRSVSPVLDLSALPALIQPSPPSNTLLITQLNDLTIFHPASLATIRQHINSLSPLHSFSPLKSFRRIVCSFYDIESAISIRQHLDGASLLSNVRTKVYFGEPTPIGEQKKYLDRPDAGRLFFISPPPSPPVGWEVREEDPPNKDVHASDLADALGKLSGKMHNVDADELPGDQEDNAAREAAVVDGVGVDANAEPPLRVTGPSFNDMSTSKPDSAAGGGANSARNRSRSSTVIYDPGAHGDSPGLPAVMVEDTTLDAMDDNEEEEAATTLAGMPPEGKKIIAHTWRPPVELMETT